jgi:hypothetical protein
MRASRYSLADSEPPAGALLTGWSDTLKSSEPGATLSTKKAMEHDAPKAPHAASVRLTPHNQAEFPRRIRDRSGVSPAVSETPNVPGVFR